LIVSIVERGNVTNIKEMMIQNYIYTDEMTDLEFNQWVDKVTNKEAGELTLKYNLQYGSN